MRSLTVLLPSRSSDAAPEIEPVAVDGGAAFAWRDAAADRVAQDPELGAEPAAHEHLVGREMHIVAGHVRVLAQRVTEVDAGVRLVG